HALGERIRLRFEIRDEQLGRQAEEACNDKRAGVLAQVEDGRQRRLASRHGRRPNIDIPDLELEQTDDHHTYDGCNPRKNWDRQEMGRVQAEVFLDTGRTHQSLQSPEQADRYADQTKRRRTSTISWLVPPRTL